MAENHKKELIEVSFRPAEGGIVSEARHRIGGEMGMHKTTTGIHGSLGHAKRHLENMIGRSEGAEKKKRHEGLKKKSAGLMRKE